VFLGGGMKSKQQFKQTLENTMHIKISDDELSLIFNIFDRNDDGHLNRESLVFLYNNRLKYPLMETDKKTLSFIWTIALGNL
ncbi:EF-hand domain-containing protein, partial [Patescibacteria group bacterium]|nr:EF-hand domain-containing protein [Patescibacteria group bacterium]